MAYAIGGCGEFAVAPMLARSCSPARCVNEAPCHPCLPRCKSPVCCDRRRPHYRDGLRGYGYGRYDDYYRHNYYDDHYRHHDGHCHNRYHDDCCHHNHDDGCGHHHGGCVNNYDDHCNHHDDHCHDHCNDHDDWNHYRRLGSRSYHGYYGHYGRDYCSPYRYRSKPCSPQRCPSPCAPHPDLCPAAACRPVRTKYVMPCYRYEDGRINQPTQLMQRACEVAIGARPRRKPFIHSSFCSDLDHDVCHYQSEDDKGNCCYHFEKKTHCTPTDNCPHFKPQTRDPCDSNPHCQYTDCVSASVVNPNPGESCIYYQ